MKVHEVVPARTIEIGSEVLVIIDDGEEWSLHADDPNLESRRSDWDAFDPAQCRPADFLGLMNQLGQSA